MKKFVVYFRGNSVIIKADYCRNYLESRTVCFYRDEYMIASFSLDTIYGWEDKGAMCDAGFSDSEIAEEFGTNILTVARIRGERRKDT